MCNAHQNNNNNNNNNNVNTSSHGISNQTIKRKFPKHFLIWCTFKTMFQQTWSFIAITFIMHSGFFNPFGYDATVWSREELTAMYLPQAIFEIIDLFFETSMLRIQTDREHLPWDSIIHHSAVAIYFIYLYMYQDSLSHSFLGLPVASISCQVVGIFFTFHRLYIRFRYLALMLLSVQVTYRIPLAIVSVYRAFQHYDEAPLVHIMICLVLASLDYRWTRFAARLHKRLQKEYDSKRQNEKKIPNVAKQETSSFADQLPKFKAL